MNIKLEFISTKEPKWHIFYKKQPKSNEGDVIVYKCGENEQAFSDEIAGCTSNMGDINQYLTFFGKVMYNLTTLPHLLPFKDNNISTESIMDKIISKVEDVVQRAVNNNCNFNGICGICPQNCHLSKNNCSKDGYIKAIYRQFNISYLQNNDTSSLVIQREPATEESILEVDTFKLEAEQQAATAMVEVNMQQFEAERHEQREKQQQEREILIAEASRLTGRVEAFNVTSKFLTVSNLITLNNIKESKIYKCIKGCETWEKYCNSLGFSAKKIDEDLRNLNTFGEEFLLTGQQLGFGYRELRNLSKQVKSGSLEIKEESVIIDGEVIPLDDKDELRDALDTLLKSKYKEIEEKDIRIKNQSESIERKDNEIARLQESNKNFFQDKQKAEKELADLKGAGTIHGISLDENIDFKKIAGIERELEVMYNHLAIVKNKDLSEFNKKKLGAVVIKAMNLLHDFHQELCSMGVCDYYGEAFMPDEVIDAAGRLETPADYLRNNK